MSVFQEIKEDLFRYEGRWSWKLFWRYFLFTPGFRYTVLLRKTKAARGLSRLFWRLILRHYQVRYGLQIPIQTSIGRGFRIVHFGAIVVNPAAEVGDNFNIAQGAVIGYAPPRRGQSEGGSPKIGNNVCVGANAIVIGKISIGDYCVIAPGAFVNQDMPPHTIALGNPATFHHKHQASSSLIVYSLPPSEH